MAIVLIVEEDKIFSKPLTETLRKSGYEVEIAADGATALKILPAVHPDLIILDLVLPEMHGLEFLRKIQEPASEFKNIPVVILSNLTGDEDSIKKMGLEVAGYFIKTKTSLKEFIAQIKSIL